MSPVMGIVSHRQRSKGRDASHYRSVRAGAGRGFVRGARRGLQAGSELGLPSRQGIRIPDGRAGARVLRGVGVPRRGRVQERHAKRRVHGVGQGRPQARPPAARCGVRRARVSQPDAPRPVDPAELGFERIRYEKSDHRATITLNRPEVLNAFDFRMLRELARACEDASWDDEIHVVVLTGAGRAFCVGADLKAWSADYLGNPKEYWKWFGAVEDAFIRHVGLEHGSVPAGGATQWLPIFVGDRRAREIILLCEEIPAARAAEWGLVNWVVPAAELDTKVEAVAGKLATKLPQTTRYAKQQLNFWRDLSWHETVNHARDWLALSMLGDEAQEAVRTFVDRSKRKGNDGT